MKRWKGYLHSRQKVKSWALSKYTNCQVIGVRPCYCLVDVKHYMWYRCENKTPLSTVLFDMFLDLFSPYIFKYSCLFSLFQFFPISSYIDSHSIFLYKLIYKSVLHRWCLPTGDVMGQGTAFILFLLNWVENCLISKIWSVIIFVKFSFYGKKEQ